MFKYSLKLLLSVGVILSLGAVSAQALPGQKKSTVVAWINGNSSLRPTVGDGLTVRRNNTAFQSFEFHASVIPPLGSYQANKNLIRAEQFSFYDRVNGVNRDRLEESLRVIYDVSIYQDYTNARIIYAYPTREMEEIARRKNLPLLAATKGELRLGDRYAYWLEMVEEMAGEHRGRTFTGKMTVFLKEDLDLVETELRAR
ncbi:MAG: hypothetical protein WA865_14210 [Spirulinaceae cyanobacterium]